MVSRGTGDVATSAMMRWIEDGAIVERYDCCVCDERRMSRKSCRVCLDSVNLPVKLKARSAALHFFFLPANVNVTELAASIFLTIATSSLVPASITTD